MDAVSAPKMRLAYQPQWCFSPIANNQKIRIELARIRISLVLAYFWSTLQPKPYPINWQLAEATNIGKSTNIARQKSLLSFLQKARSPVPLPRPISVFGCKVLIGFSYKPLLTLKIAPGCAIIQGADTAHRGDRAFLKYRGGTA